MVKKEMDDYKQKGTVWLRAYKNEIAITVLIIVILILSPMLSPFFLSGSNLLNLLRQTAYTAIAAIGMYFVILIGGIDPSIGATIQIIGMVSITKEMRYKNSKTVRENLIQQSSPKMRSPFFDEIVRKTDFIHVLLFQKTFQDCGSFCSRCITPGVKQVVFFA